MSKANLVLLLFSMIIFGLSFQRPIKNERKILSTINRVSINDKSFQILKIQTNSGILIEIYDLSKSMPILNSKFESLNQKDGYFILGGTGTNLAAFDINHDRIPEILVPTFDNNFTSNLDIIKYDLEKNKFFSYESEEYIF